ncbi:GH43 family beta-xylosidase [Kineococcus xinjiangensis]|uniref:GH43 family beta-xylosidase n=1 Tax=Kineococcus xinjiangensis TaxID=512762 RepID=A0A2S6IK99_9ACTN|nr:family 43 glycosylhydrolase [Kineococcus xinjiangensis]PPK94601.1 GH43 family beta-xylosidase [Kineococcus xinjiangensis]
MSHDLTSGVSRRLLLAGGLGAAAATGLTVGASATVAAPPKGVPLTDAQIYGVPTLNPLVEKRADPFITPRTDGTYYFTGSVPEYDRLVVRGAPTLAGLRDAEESVVWRRPLSGRMGGHIWAPELHRIDGRWYIYFAAGDSDNVFAIRMYAIESSLADPRDPAGWGDPQEVVTPWGWFKLDATTFEHRGRRYYVWAQAEPELAVNTSLYIAEMSSPWAIKGEPVRISTPTLSWEMRGFRVNEGAAVLIRNGKVFITYSASATDANYCMGLLTADAKADLLDFRSWTKSQEPVFTTNVQTSQYGPGHNSFTVAEDGVTDVLVYHARDYRDIVGDPLYDHNRHARVQKVYWHPDGTPLFGVPVGTGGPIVRLSPADVRSAAYVRHAEFVLRVDEAPRELADSQFRFVPGLAGAGTESIQSVNFPDRYVRIVDGEVRIDPVQPGDAAAPMASFRRVPTKWGVALQAAGDTGTYLRHESGRLTAGPAAGARTSFRLS